MHVADGELVLSGPSDRSDRAHLPVRGDLAHIRLAGRYFVPHYVVPMAYRVKGGAESLRASAKPGAADLAAVAVGDGFDVLDISGGWAWGQLDGDGLVGYLPMDAIEPA